MFAEPNFAQFGETLKLNDSTTMFMVFGLSGPAVFMVLGFPGRPRTSNEVPKPMSSTCGRPNSSACGPSSTLLGRTGLSGVADRVERRSFELPRSLGARILMQIY